MDEKSELRWNWPACPLATESPGPNLLLLFGEGKEGTFENHVIFPDPDYQPPEHRYLGEDEGQGRVRQTYWPTAADLQAVAGYAFRPERLGDVDWLKVQSVLVRKKLGLADLKRCSAPELVAMLKGEGRRGKPPEQIKRETRAIVLRAEHPDWTHKQVAQALGVSESTVKRMESYMEATKRQQSGGFGGVVQGYKDKTGSLEAADE